MQQPPIAPPQWSADGEWWWDGSQWRPRSEMMPAPSQAFPMPAPMVLKPSPGLRIFLLVMLGLAVLITGGFSLFGFLGVSAGANTSADIELFVFFVVLFVFSTLGLVGVAIRARWSRLAAIIAGIVVSLSCVGLVLGIPIVIAAMRAPDMTKQPAQAAAWPG